MAIRFLNTVLSGSLKVSGSFTLPPIDTGSTGVVGQIGMSAEVPYIFTNRGWKIVSGSSPVPPPVVGEDIEYLVIAGGGGAAKGGGGAGGYLSSSLSEKPISAPAPVSTYISFPSLTRVFTELGVNPTLYSLFFISFGTDIFIYIHHVSFKLRKIKAN